MALIIQKFGGSILTDEQQFNKIAHFIAASYKEEHQLVVVVSAMKGTTDFLLNQGHQVNSTVGQGPCLDLLLALGEQKACALLGLALEQQKIPFVIKSGFRVGLQQLPDGQWSVDTDAYAKALRKHVLVVSGFQALNTHDQLITLGRGGSDLTAILLAHFLHAERCFLFKDVPGIAHHYTGHSDDPYYKCISLTELLQLSQKGASIVQQQAIRFALQKNVNFEVVNLQYQGTYVYASLPPAPLLQ